MLSPRIWDQDAVELSCSIIHVHFIVYFHAADAAKGHCICIIALSCPVHFISALLTVIRDFMLSLDMSTLQQYCCHGSSYYAGLKKNYK